MSSNDEELILEVKKIFDNVYYKVRRGCVTKCDSFFITKCDWGYHKVRRVIQSVIEVITKCDRYYKVWLRLLQSATRVRYKVRQLFYYKVWLRLLQSATGNAKCDWGYYKVRQVLQSVIEIITKCDDYYKVRQYSHLDDPILPIDAGVRSKHAAWRKSDRIRRQKSEVSTPLPSRPCKTCTSCNSARNALSSRDIRDLL